MTPKQKAAMVRLLKNDFQRVSLAVGDGANDVSMIREANVGVGIRGKEGLQAVNSADFALSQFKHLKKAVACTRPLRIFTRYAYNGSRFLCKFDIQYSNCPVRFLQRIFRSANIY